MLGGSPHYEQSEIQGSQVPPCLSAVHATEIYKWTIHLWNSFLHMMGRRRYLRDSSVPMRAVRYILSYRFDPIECLMIDTEWTPRSDPLPLRYRPPSRPCPPQPPRCLPYTTRTSLGTSARSWRTCPSAVRGSSIRHHTWMRLPPHACGLKAACPSSRSRVGLPF